MANNNLQSSPRPGSAAGSSQDEYEESSSESDRVLNSSNEDLAPKETGGPEAGEDGVPEEEDEDDASTALGVRTSESVFTPQPNAFSHPPSSQTSRDFSVPGPQPESYFPPADRLPNNRTITSRDLRRPTTRSPRSTHTPYNMISPSHTYQPDHDAALRASLSTLLSCAAAARGLPKRDSQSRTTTRHPGGDAIEPSSLRMVPESALLGEDLPAPTLPARRPLHPPTSSASNSAPSPPSSNKASAAKRKAQRETSKDRNSKKSRAASSSKSGYEETAISPTLMTWMVSAGVVILVSAISFSAGFVWGREVGRIETGCTTTAELARQSNSCGSELAARAGGLKRLRWGSGGAASVVA